MAIFISKNAIEDIPIGEEASFKDKGGLYSGILSNDRYLVGMAKNNNAYRPLHKGVNHTSVRTITSAFRIIASIYSNVPAFTFSGSDGFDFDDRVETNVKLFQTWVGLPSTGVFDVATLLELDKRINKEAVVDELSQQYVGQKSNVIIRYAETQAGNTYMVKISVQGLSTTKTVATPAPASGRPITNKGSAKVALNDQTKQPINNENPELGNVYYSGELDLQQATYYYIKNDTFMVSDSDSLEEEMDKIPFTHYDDPGTLYKVSAGEDFSNIVLQNYYNTGATDIIDPYTDTVIFTLPNRVPFAPAKRAEDARFQFYLNLLYYSNTYEMGTNPLKQWGMKKAAAYQRYNVEHLDAFNIFDNNYDAGNPQTALPNYYRFLKHMESVNPASKLLFDATGRCTSFEADAGKYIYIPSRQFADSLYYFLNYRSGEMLQTAGPDKMEQLQGTALDAIISTLRNAMNTISGLITEVKTDAEQLYEEAAQYFIKAYEFAIQSVIQYWPRGAGGRLGGDVDIVWGIPLATKGTVERSLWRDMSKKEEFTICFSEKMSVGVGVEVMAGGSIGLYSGSGKNRKGLGINVGGGASVIPTIIASNQYTFPVRTEETAVLAGMMAVFGGAMVDATAQILQFFHVVNLDPRQYMTKGEITFENNLSVWGAAQAGLSSNNGNLKIKQGQPENVQEAQKSFGYIDNIVNCIPGIGIQLSGEIVAGVSLTFEAKYDQNPLLPELNARVFSESSADIKFFVKGELDTGALGNFLQRLFITNILPTSGFFDVFNFDNGVMLGYETKFKRLTPANQVTLNDIKVKTTGTPLSTVTVLPNGDLKYTNTANDRIEKTSSLYFGMFSGDVDALTQHGSEAKLKLNTGELRKMFTQQNYVYNLENVVKALGGFSFRKKVGAFEKKSQTARKRENKLSRLPDMDYSSKAADAFSRPVGSQVEMTLLGQLMANAKNPIGPLMGGLALHLEIDFKFADFQAPLLILQFYIDKLYCKYILLESPVQRNALENLIKLNRAEILRKIEKQNSSLSQVEKYQLLFSKQIENAGTTNQFEGLNLLISKQIQDNPKPNVNHLDALIRFVTAIIVYGKTMDNIPPQTAQERLDTGLEDFLDIVSFITNLMNLKVSLEVLFGLEVGARVALGEGLTAKVALGGFLHATYNGRLYENGQPTDVGINDTMKDILNEIERLLGRPSNNKKVGAKALFNLLKQ